MFATQTSSLMSLTDKMTYPFQISSSFCTITANCLLDIFAWMSPRNLRIIMSKTELLIFTAPIQVFLKHLSSQWMAPPTTLRSQPEPGGLSWSTHSPFLPITCHQDQLIFPLNISSMDLSFLRMLALPCFKHGQIQKLSILFNVKTLTRARVMEKEGDQFIWKLEETWTHHRGEDITFYTKSEASMCFGSISYIHSSDCLQDLLQCVSSTTVSCY